MRDAISVPSAPGLIVDALHSDAATRLAERVDLPARAEALVDGARPIVDRARGRRPARHRKRNGMILVVVLLAAVGAWLAWSASRRRRDDEFARLMSEPAGPRVSPVASGPTSPSAPAPGSPAPEQPEPAPPGAPAAPHESAPVSASQPARGRVQNGVPSRTASPAPSPYLRSHRTELPPLPGARPSLPR